MSKTAFLSKSAAACLAAAMAMPAGACTLWASAGPQDSDGGTLLSKNRDWTPGQRQALEYRYPSHGIPYFGLFAVDSRARGIKSGVNRQGLSAVTASASSIPGHLRASQPGKHGILGRYAYKVLDRGVTAHTNYYLDQTLADFNIKIGHSSATRYRRVGELLADARQPYTLARYAAISRDRHDGPDDSLWRTGRKEATLSSWILDSPAQGSQTLRVVLDNPGMPEAVRTWTLDDAFWARGKPTGA